MINEILSLICLIIVFMGLVALGYYIILRILRPKKGGSYSLVIAADSNSGDIEDRICSEFMRMEILGECARGSIITLDIGMTAEQRRRCEEFCRETKGVFVCSPDKLSELIKTIQTDGSA